MEGLPILIGLGPRTHHIGAGKTNSPQMVLCPPTTDEMRYLPDHKRSMMSQASPSAFYLGNRSCCGHPKCDLMPG